MSSKGWPVGPEWRVILEDAGIGFADALRRAGLPDDLFARPTLLDSAEYFRLWGSIEELGGPAIGLALGAKVSADSFDAPMFAALCSRTLDEAAQRVATYKRLIAPATLHVDIGKAGTALELEWLDPTAQAPAALIDGELAFFVQLARLGTRSHVCPLEVTSPRIVAPRAAYLACFGVAPSEGPRPRLVFRPADATRPFLTANARMWDVFEPALRRRLSEIDDRATHEERVRAALLELLPAGKVSMDSVARKLGTAARTMQRRLKQEGVTFQDVLDRTREHLARHYLTTSRMSGAEISFLLGFEDPNSFVRAFHKWTGTTPDQVRESATATG